jgi:hypothetical protein
MKKGLLACVIASFVIGNPFPFHLQEYSVVQQTSITGRISPAEAADVICVIDMRDTLKTALVWGGFFLPVKPGTYKLFVSAKAPYKNASLGNVEVKQNQALNVGELILQK